MIRQDVELFRPRAAHGCAASKAKQCILAAVYLLSSDKFLWKRAQKALTGYSVNFNSLDLSGISTEGYALYMAARTIYRGDVDISLSELCDADLIDDSIVMTVLGGVLLLRNGIGMLKWRI